MSNSTSGPTLPHGDYSARCKSEFVYIHAMAKPLKLRDICIDEMATHGGSPRGWRVQDEEGRVVAWTTDEEAAQAARRLLQIEAFL